MTRTGFHAIVLHTNKLVIYVCLYQHKIFVMFCTDKGVITQEVLIRVSILLPCYIYMVQNSFPKYMYW